MARIALVDVDSSNFPNLALMKISAYHKRLGDIVEWHVPCMPYDACYISKVFTESPDYDKPILADQVFCGGTGYGTANTLDPHIERMHPDYRLYPQHSGKAYGFLTRGCPRGCPFCIVGEKEGMESKQVAVLSDFWFCEPVIKLLDPNLLACPNAHKILYSILSKTTHSGPVFIDFTQGLDIRLCDAETIKILNQLRVKSLHFAWDNPKHDLTDDFDHFSLHSNVKDYRKRTVYILTNYWSTHEEDMWRIQTLQLLGYTPYIMVYDKQKYVDKNGRPMPKAHAGRTEDQFRHFLLCHHLQRWCNNKRLLYSTSFYDYMKDRGELELLKA